MNLPSSFFGWVGFILEKYGSLFLSGVGVTLLVALTGTVIGFLLGLLVAILRTIPLPPKARWYQRLPLKALHALLSVYIEVFRGTPMIVQAMVIYYGLLRFASVKLPLIVASMLIVGINTGAYMAESVRGGIFSVDPGTRQGGRLLTNLRKSALGGVEEEPEFEDLTSFALREEQAGRSAARDMDDDWDDEDDMFEFGLSPLFKPLSPCTHFQSCPMLDRRSTAWCHVNAPAEHAPQALRDLSARAGLDKDSISLSFLLLKKIDEEEAEKLAEEPQRSRRPQSRRKLWARIVSDAFIVPDYPGRARYACTELGLALIPDSAHLTPGALCEGWTTSGLDRKSQAFIMMLDDGEVRRPARSFPPRERQDEGRVPRGSYPAEGRGTRDGRREQQGGDRRSFRRDEGEHPFSRRDRDEAPRHRDSRRRDGQEERRSPRQDSRPADRRPSDRRREEGERRPAAPRRRRES